MRHVDTVQSFSFHTVLLILQETTEVCLCFKEEVKDFVQGKMELEIYNLEDRSEKFEIKDVERINPYTFKFTSHGQ